MLTPRRPILVSWLCVLLMLSGCSLVGDDTDDQVGAEEVDAVGDDTSGTVEEEATTCVAADGTTIDLTTLADLPSPSPESEITAWLGFDGGEFADTPAAQLGSLDGWALLSTGTLVDRTPLDSAGSRAIVNSESLAFELCPGADVAESTPVLRCSADGDWNTVTITWWGPTVAGEIEIIRDGELIHALDQAEGPREAPSTLDWAMNERLLELGNQGPWTGVLRADSGVFTDFSTAVDEPLAYQLVLHTGDDQFTAECGAASLTSEIASPTCVVGEDNGYPTFVARYDQGAVGPDANGLLRDGEPLEVDLLSAEIVDTTGEPGRSYDYDLTILLREADEPVIVPCGPVQRAAPEIGSDELAQARDRLVDLMNRPYLYMTFTVDGVEHDGFGGPAADGFVADPPLLDGALFDLATIHDELAAGLASGDQVAYELDPFSGIPTAFFIDGREWTIQCVEYDTAPPELREGPCQESNNLVGR